MCGNTGIPIRRQPKPSENTEFFPYFAGESALAPCVEKLKQASRNYAKRQLSLVPPHGGYLLAGCLCPGCPGTGRHVSTKRVFSERMSDMQEENREGISGALKTLAAVVIVFLLLAALYVGYQAMQVLLPAQYLRDRPAGYGGGHRGCRGRAPVRGRVTLRAMARWGIWWQTVSVFRQAQRWLRSTAMQRRLLCAGG